MVGDSRYLRLGFWGSIVSWTITVDWREPKDRAEAGLYGRTYKLHGGMYYIFINKKKNPPRSIELLKTLLHEFVHAILWMGEKRFNDKREHWLCNTLEDQLGSFVKWVK